MANNSILYSTEPNWVFNHPGLRQRMPEKVQSWIYESGSLTKRIKEHYQDAFSLSVLFHQWKRPFLSETRSLCLPGNKYCLTREVLLSAHEQPLILARTIIPVKTLKGAQRTLSRLGTRPLGEVIFCYPKLARLEMDIALIAPGQWSSAAQKIINHDQKIWGRRTVYAIQQRRMLVSEFFLPGVLEI